MIKTVQVAALDLAGVGGGGPNDADRRSYTFWTRNQLVLVDADLGVLHSWSVECPAGWHATSPDLRALISGPGEVRLLDGGGQVVWAHQHTPWQGQGQSFEAGCVWFDTTGALCAVVPAPGYVGCLALRFCDQGQVVAEVPLGGEPAGITVLPQPGGWVGLSEGEGQDATRAWWLRPDSDGRFELLDARWDDAILADVDATGGHILTTPHGGGPITVRAFPSLEPVRRIDGPDEDGG